MKIRTLTALIILLTLVAGCGQAGSMATPEPTTQPPAPTTTPLPPTNTSPPPTNTSELAATTEPASPPAGDSQGRIAFYSGRDGNDEIYVVSVPDGTDADGSDLRRLTDNVTTDQAPAWSPDGTQLAFVSDRDGNREIYVMTVPDGTDTDDVEQSLREPQRLTNNSAYESHPAWSPDGTQIAFISERDGNREIYAIAVPDGTDTDSVEPSSREPRRLTNDPAADMRPAWSPDGRQIAFNSERDGNWEIYVMDADGGNLRRLTDSPTWEVFPAWSPDGTQIAYRHSAARDWNGDIWVMDADGSNKQQLTRKVSNDENPSWSPDGKQIVFQSDRYADPQTAGTDAYNFELLIMDADGDNVRRLTDHPAGDYWPTWGPSPSQPTPIAKVADTPSPTATPVQEEMTSSTSGSLGDTWTRPSDDVTMIYVPGGAFPMGSTDAEIQDALARCRQSYRYCNSDFYGSEAPQHTVTLDSFWLDRTEVTNAQYRRCVEDGTCQAPTLCDKGEPTFDDESKTEHPVVCVDWYDAQTYCDWAGARLPTEAEWEYAARGPEGYLYPWGNERGGPWQNYCDANCTEAWADETVDDGYATSSPVDGYAQGASWCGALDLAGNTYEWVADWKGSYSSAPQTNPTGPATGGNKVLRGSSWLSFWDRARGATRDSGEPEARKEHGGFRCARDATMPESIVDSPQGTGNVNRMVLTFGELINGLDATSPMDDGALAIPDEAAPSEHVFEGRLELIGEADSGNIQILRGDPNVDPEVGHLPEFSYEFVQSDGYLIPTQRGLIIADHPNWNYILGPGRIWQEKGDQGYSRASFPFALVWKGGNATFNGIMTFLFDGESVPKVWYQITQETTSSLQANFWGLLEAQYHPGPVQHADQVRADFARELAHRFPTKPIEQLAEDYPGVDVSAFGRGISPEHRTMYGFVINGVNYVGECHTRFGRYAYCDYMRATSYSTAKSAFVSVALMRLAEKYGPAVAELLIKNYVPEHAGSPGDWHNVTFNHTLDMATGNYRSPGRMVDEDGAQMGEYWAAQPYAERIAAAFDWPHSADPGTRWVYRTCDTFILTRALHNYLKSQEGPGADIFEFVVDEVYRPLKIGPGAHTTMRTDDDNWQGQAEGGYGLWWVQDDIAKIATLLNSDGGTIDGQQILHPALLAAAMQQDPDDRGVDNGPYQKYNNAFWAEKYTQADGFDCEFWVPQMLGVSGNAVILMPNGSTYYYFSDNRQFTWDAAVKESDKIIPHCP